MVKLVSDFEDVSFCAKCHSFLFAVFLCTLVMERAQTISAKFVSDDEEWDPPTEFAVMLATVAKLLDKSADVEQLKQYLQLLCHPHTGQCYINIRLYEHCNTPGEIIKALHPQYIHFMHTHLLRQIVNIFGDEQSKMLLKHYEDNFPRKKPLKRMCDPLSDEEINACTGTKITIIMDQDAIVDTTTMKDVERVRQYIARTTGVDESMIVYTDQTPATSGTNPKQYEDNFPRKKPLKRMHDPLLDEEIESETNPKHGENTDIQ